MLGRKKKPIERLPWYRARNYRGDLTENEKRQLDSFRMRREHPAASYDTLPGEVKVYMGELTLEIYDTKQERLRVACSVVSGASVFSSPVTLLVMRRGRCSSTLCLLECLYSPGFITA
jgi:hypothetical protein